MQCLPQRLPMVSSALFATSRPPIQLRVFLWTNNNNTTRFFHPASISRTSRFIPQRPRSTFAVVPANMSYVRLLRLLFQRTNYVLAVIWCFVCSRGPIGKEHVADISLTLILSHKELHSCNGALPDRLALHTHKPRINLELQRPRTMHAHAFMGSRKMHPVHAF
jgi:hypothetical protein